MKNLFKHLLDSHVNFALLTACAFAVASCSPVPLGQEKPITYAISSTKGSQLQQISTDLLADGNGTNSFIPLDTGNQALGARLHLIDMAEQTLDIQYFLMKPDISGALVSTAILRAADRGVRVRFLLDDVFTTVKDQDLGLLDAHPDIDLRIYNPAARPGPKALGFLTEFQRVNRRMHNKSLTADGVFSIIGGRNIADEYFEVNPTAEFADLDVLVTGSAVKDISKAFDLYWNDDWAIPLSSLRKPLSSEQIAEKQTALAPRVKSGRSLYKRAINDPFFDELSRSNASIFWGDVEVVVDHPDKLKMPVVGGQRILAEDLLKRIKSAEKSVTILTPYFVPENYGARLFSDLARRGVSVRVVTNSIASNNHVYTHAGYRRHREALLAAGVKLNEIRADSLQAQGAVDVDASYKVVLHTKLAIIDDKEVFVGSLNLDPRSIKLNSEIGMFIQSPKFARQSNNQLEDAYDRYTYEVDLTESGSLTWKYFGASPTTVSEKEPGATFGRQLIVGFTELLSIELQL